MSRIGKLPVEVPNKVTVSIDKEIIVVKGPKGELSMPLSNELSIDQNDNILTFQPLNDSPKAKKLYGTYRASVANMIQGVTQGF